VRTFKIKSFPWEFSLFDISIPVLVYEFPKPARGQTGRFVVAAQSCEHHTRGCKLELAISPGSAMGCWLASQPVARRRFVWFDELECSQSGLDRCMQGSDGILILPDPEPRLTLGKNAVGHQALTLLNG
jgi:hypothetical protein